MATKNGEQTNKDPTRLARLDQFALSKPKSLSVTFSDELIPLINLKQVKKRNFFENILKAAYYAESQRSSSSELRSGSMAKKSSSALIETKSRSSSPRNDCRSITSSQKLMLSKRLANNLVMLKMLDKRISESTSGMLNRSNMNTSDTSLLTRRFLSSSNNEISQNLNLSLEKQSEDMILKLELNKKKRACLSCCVDRPRKWLGTGSKTENEPYSSRELDRNYEMLFGQMNRTDLANKYFYVKNLVEAKSQEILHHRKNVIFLKRYFQLFKFRW